MAIEAISKSGSTGSPRTVGVLGPVRPEPVEGPGVRGFKWLLGDSMFLLGILSSPVGMFESERIHLH